MNEVIKLLTEKNKTISTMESCTGGGIANAITNIEDLVKYLSLEQLLILMNIKLKWE